MTRLNDLYELRKRVDREIAAEEDRLRSSAMARRFEQAKLIESGVVETQPTAEEVRAWARENGIPVGARGAVQRSLVERYQRVRRAAAMNLPTTP